MEKGVFFMYYLRERYSHVVEFFICIHNKSLLKDKIGWRGVSVSSINQKLSVHKKEQLLFMRKHIFQKRSTWLLFMSFNAFGAFDAFNAFNAFNAFDALTLFSNPLYTLPPSLPPSFSSSLHLLSYHAVFQCHVIWGRDPYLLNRIFI